MATNHSHTIFHKSGYSLSCFPLHFLFFHNEIRNSGTHCLHECMYTNICEYVHVCVITRMESLECKYASVRLQLNRKSSSRMIESQSFLSFYSTNAQTCAHTNAHIQSLAHMYAQRHSVQIFFLCKVSQMHGNAKEFLDFSCRHNDNQKFLTISCVFNIQLCHQTKTKNCLRRSFQIGKD